MSSRVIVQLLLSLLLLVSQQLALSHVYTHVPGQAPVQLSQDDGGGNRSVAADHLCGLCVSGDQLTHALGVPTYSFHAVRPEYLPLAAADTPAACQRTVCVYQSRAPPLA
jgi:hypothetical protein